VPEHVRLEGPAPAVPGAPVADALLVVFSASWCAPCREEVPSLLALASAPPEGLKVTVLMQDQDAAEVADFFGGPPPALLHVRMDPEGEQTEPFGVSQLPTAFLLVRGQKVARFVGKHDWSTPQMRALLGQLTGAGAGGSRGAARGWRC
jgi:thiol-disulfide isomerase/thioredoxin